MLNRQPTDEEGGKEGEAQEEKRKKGREEEDRVRDCDIKRSNDGSAGIFVGGKMFEGATIFVGPPFCGVQNDVFA